MENSFPGAVQWGRQPPGAVFIGSPAQTLPTERDQDRSCGAPGLAVGSSRDPSPASECRRLQSPESLRPDGPCHGSPLCPLPELKTCHEKEAAMVPCLSICTPLSKGAALLWCPGILCKHPRGRPVLAQQGGDRAQVLKERAVEDMTKVGWNLLGPRWRKIRLPEDPEPQDRFAATRQLTHTHGASTAPRPRRAKMWAVP